MQPPDVASWRNSTNAAFPRAPCFAAVIVFEARTFSDLALLATGRRLEDWPPVATRRPRLDAGFRTFSPFDPRLQLLKVVDEDRKLTAFDQISTSERQSTGMPQDTALSANDMRLIVDGKHEKRRIIY